MRCLRVRVTMGVGGVRVTVLVVRVAVGGMRMTMRRHFRAANWCELFGETSGLYKMEAGQMMGGKACRELLNSVTSAEFIIELSQEGHIPPRHANLNKMMPMLAPVLSHRAFAALVPRGAGLLGVDPGSAKCGFAVRIEGVGDAARRAGVARSPRGSDPAFRAALFARVVADLVSAHRLRGVIMGCPARGGAPSTLGCSAHVRDLVAAVLSSSPSLPILLWDEHNSSVIARRGERVERALAAAAANGSAPRAIRALPRNIAIDDAAALVILQSYIDASEGSAHIK